MFKQALRWIFFAIIVRIIVLILMGTNIRHRENLPQKGPAILVANHNSHLDTLVLISLFPLSKLSWIQPVAAADYFLSNKLFSWFARNIIGIIPIHRLNIKKVKTLFYLAIKHSMKTKLLSYFQKARVENLKVYLLLKKALHKGEFLFVLFL